MLYCKLAKQIFLYKKKPARCCWRHRSCGLIIWEKSKTLIVLQKQLFLIIYIIEVSMSKMGSGNKKLYKSNHVALATFLGGPLATGLMMSSNYKVFGNSKRASQIFLISFIVTIGLLIFAVYLPKDLPIPGLIIPLCYSFLAGQLAKKLHEKLVNEYTSQGFEVVSWWKVIAVSAISLALSALLLLIISFVLVLLGIEPK